jgi:DNA polymerase-3 subunit epsilon
MMMTGGQTDLGLSFQAPEDDHQPGEFELAERPPLQVLRPSEEEAAAHEARLKAIHDTADKVLWRDL